MGFCSLFPDPASDGDFADLPYAQYRRHHRYALQEDVEVGEKTDELRQWRHSEISINHLKSDIS